jgi:hypothetical protein
MPKPPGQSEFVYQAPPEDPDAATRGAGKTATRSVYTIMIIALVLLFALVAIGLHIPAE